MPENHYLRMFPCNLSIGGCKNDEQFTFPDQFGHLVGVMEALYRGALEEGGEKAA